MDHTWGSAPSVVNPAIGEAGNGIQEVVRERCKLSGRSNDHSFVGVYLAGGSSDHDPPARVDRSHHGSRQISGEHRVEGGLDRPGGSPGDAETDSGQGTPDQVVDGGRVDR